MPIQTVRNQYRGVNAHLHSFWQASRTWNRFHNVMIAGLMQSLKASLIPMGYTADIEESIQIRRYDQEVARPEADILTQTLDRLPRRSARRAPIESAQAVALRDLLDEDENTEHPYLAVAIRPLRRANSGEPVGWVELLSPSNKGSSEDAQTYRVKRQRLVKAGLTFVEIDLLHERPPTFLRLRDYSRGEPDSHPYRIVVLAPAVENGTSYIFEFDVDSPIPSAPIPLLGDDLLIFDFDAVYQKVFIDSLFGYDLNYAALPVGFERYSAADQARIARRMLAVLEAARAGIDLEAAAPLLTDESLSLEAALERLQPMLEGAPT
jgi:hypothetical protein